MLELQTSTVGSEALSGLERELYRESHGSTDVKETDSFWQRLSDLYFQPKFFEKSGKLYEALGVNWFRKYFPNGGSYWTQRGQSSMVKGRKKEDLESFVRLTKRLEGIHTFGALPFFTIIAAAISLADKAYVVAGVGVVFNLVTNLYPIMSQRYNRNKANKMLERLEEREAGKVLVLYR